MRTLAAALLAFALCGCAAPTTPGEGAAPFSIDGLDIEGTVDADNATFSLACTVEVARAEAVLPLVRGEVSWLDGRLPSGSELVRDGDAYLLRFAGRGTYPVAFRFAARVAAPDAAGARTIAFEAPPALIRRLKVAADRADARFRIAGAAEIEQTVVDGRATVSGLLSGAEGRGVSVGWTYGIHELEGSLSLASDANTIATARVGVLHLDTVFRFRIVQGRLERLAFDVPPALTVTQVRGADIREWRIDAAEGGGRRLVVVLNRPLRDAYVLRVEGDVALARFPCAFDFPALAPLDVLQAGGSLLLGADSAVRLVVESASGLTQIDPADAPDVESTPPPPRALPQRSLFAYQYANLPLRLRLTADDIVSAVHAEEQIVVTVKDPDLTADVGIELDVRDAPARDVAIAVDPAWTVAAVEGGNVADYDVREEAGRRLVRVFFREGAMGRARVDLRLERTLAAGAASFDAPAPVIDGARSERGYVILRAEPGLRIEPRPADALREIPVLALPARVAGAQHAWRFKASDWSLAAAIVREEPAVHAEVFHLASLGEGGFYGSCLVTYNIAGAPTRTFKLHIPADCRNVEIAGRDVRGWQQDGETWTVSLQDRAAGDYNLLVTYGRDASDAAAGVPLGGIRTLGTRSETGYLVLAGGPGLEFGEQRSADPAALPISPQELPREYAALVRRPILKAYRCVGAPHAVEVSVHRLAAAALLDHVADHVAFATRLSDEGEAVTEATYFVKNASQQHLGLRLPEGARLWAATVDGAAARPLEDPSGAVLVPIERRRDPNQPSSVVFTYAEQRAAPGWWRSLTFRAPRSEARNVFATWTLRLPEGYRVVAARGNMRPSPRARPGLLDWFRRVGRIYAWWFRLPAPAVRAPAPDSTWEFTKSVTMADDELRLTVWMVPAWLAIAAQALRLPAAVAAGWLLLRRARRRSRGRLLARAAAAALALWAIAGWPAVGPASAVAFALALPFAIVGGGIVAGHRCLEARRARAAAAPPPVPARTPTAPAAPSPATPGHVFRDRLPPTSPGAPGDAPGSTAGSTPLRILPLLLTAAAAASLALAAEPPAPPDAVPCNEVPAATNVVDEARVEIDVPAPPAAYASVRLTVAFDASRGQTLDVLPYAGVFLERFASARGGAEIERGPEGYRLRCARGGRVEATIAYRADGGGGRLRLWVPLALKSALAMRLPGVGWRLDVPTAASRDVREEGGRTTAEFALAGGPRHDLSWTPLERQTALEKTVFSATVSTVALFQPGVVRLTHRIEYEISQGQLPALALRLPEHVSVTAVAGEEIATWRFDPATRQLDVALRRPAAGRYVLTVADQIARERPPYTVALAEPEVVGAERQRGTLALAATDEVQVAADRAEGLLLMSAADFSEDAARTALAAVAAARRAEIKRAYRYQSLPASTQVAVDVVLPEIRVEEAAQVDLSDERVLLTTRLQLDVTRAGVFGVALELPEGFDIDSLTGEDVSHWDEVRQEGRIVQVHFARQALGPRALNLVLSRAERKLEAEVSVPRVTVRGALKHAGTLTVSGERGLRLSTLARDGASEINPRELGLPTPGLLAYRLLRPDWRLTLKTDALAPVVKADVLQRVDVSEGLLRLRAHVLYAIEHAGVKTFRVRSPQPGTALVFTGRNIARVVETDPAAGLWEVELTGKVDGEYALEIGGQFPVPHGTREVVVPPLRTEGTDSQKGYLVVFAGERLRVAPRGVPDGFRPEDARAIPARFGAGDLSAAVLCYRAMPPGGPLTLSVVRHESADVLAARVREVSLTTVVSEDDQSVTRAELRLDAGALRYLDVALPPDAEIWSAFVNGRAVAPLGEAGACKLPLEAAAGGDASIDFIYATRRPARGFGGRHEYEGPRFALPLANLRWTFYVPPSYVVHASSGTMRRRDEPAGVVVFTTELYNRDNRFAVEANARKAEEVLREGGQLWKSGRQADALNALEQAIAYSQGQEGLNEDARVQYRSFARQQAVVGLATRRSALRQSLNGPVDEREQQQLSAYNDGRWTPDFQKEVEQRLGAKESDSLSRLAERLIDQQEAADADRHPIRVTLPVQGRRLVFARDLQVRPGAEMRVVFRATPARLLRAPASLAAAAALAAILALVFGLYRRRT